MVFCLKSLQLQGRWPDTDFPWPFSSSPCSALLTPRVCTHPHALGLLTYFTNGSAGGGPEQVCSVVWSQTAVCGLAPWCISVASCFIGYFCCPLFSPPSPATGSLCVLVLALLWQSVGVGTTVYSQHFPGTINNKAPSTGQVERVFVIVHCGIDKGPSVFSSLNECCPVHMQIKYPQQRSRGDS